MVRSRLLFVSLMLIVALGGRSAAGEILIGTAAPLTGRLAWYGEQYQRAVELALDEINESGGPLGRQVDLVLGDDACIDERGPALARSLVERGVVAVIGHTCSGVAIAAAPIYEAAGIVMISGSATNPALTEAGRPNVFRTVGRDDLQGKLAGDYLAEHHTHDRIAILFEEDVYVRGLAVETRKRLHELGLEEALFLGFDDVRTFDWGGLVQRLTDERIDVIYFPARSPDVALFVRYAAEAGERFDIIGGDSLHSEDFWLMAGAAGEGIIFTSVPDARTLPTAAHVVDRFRDAGYEPEGYTLYVYAALQAWAQAITQAGTFDPAAVMRVLREADFETVLGTIGFDAKGDVTGYDPFTWYVWRNGDYVLLERAGMKE